jgi:hypothetical protein
MNEAVLCTRAAMPKSHSMRKVLGYHRDLLKSVACEASLVLAVEFKTEAVNE